ncbi:MAG: hypothetical protein ABI693_31350 [Bryobacteraceae bacterium]
MKKLLAITGLTLLSLGLSVPSAFGASDVRQDRRELARDKAELRHDSRKLARAENNGNVVRAQRLKREVRQDKREIRHDARDLRHDRY